MKKKMRFLSLQPSYYVILYTQFNRRSLLFKDNQFNIMFFILYEFDAILRNFITKFDRNLSFL